MNCPACNRLLYSRRHRHCGFCGAELPPEALLTEEEVAAIEAEKKEIEARRAKAKAKEEEENRKRSASDIGGDIMMMTLLGAQTPAFGAPMH